MRVVVDTNIVVSAFLFGGPPLALLTLAQQGQIELVTSDAATAELLRVLHRDKFSKRLHELELTPEDVVSKFKDMAALIEPSDILNVCRDADDNVFIGIAHSAEADLIVSGDKHLLACSQKSPVPVVRVSEFLAMLQGLTSVQSPKAGCNTDSNDYCQENTNRLNEFLRKNHDIQLVASSGVSHEAQFSIRYTKGISMEIRIAEFLDILSSLKGQVVRRSSYPHNILIFVRFPPESFNFNWVSDGQPAL